MKFKQSLQQLFSTGVKRADKLSANTPGFGIGLFISNKIAENLAQLKQINGGGVKFESIENYRSRFWFHVKHMETHFNENRAYRSQSFYPVDKNLNNLKDNNLFEKSPKCQPILKSLQYLNQYNNIRFIGIPMSSSIIIQSQISQKYQDVKPQNILQFQDSSSSLGSNNLNQQPSRYSVVRPIQEQFLVQQDNQDKSNDGRQIRSDGQNLQNSIEQHYRTNNKQLDYEESVAFETNLFEQQERTRYFTSNKRINNNYQSQRQPKQTQQQQQVLPQQEDHKNYQDNEKILQLVQACSCQEILIVDDEYVNILGLNLLLKQFNLVGDYVFNGQECLNKIKQRIELNCQSNHQKYYKLIFMDISMPILDGISTMRYINQLRINEFTKVLACTAFADLETKSKCFEVGMEQLINKPVKKRELQKLLEFYGLCNST